MAYNRGNALGDNPIVIIIGVIAGLIAILGFLTGKENLPEIREYLGLSSSEKSHPEEPKPLPEDNFDDQKKAGVAAYHAGKYEEAYRLLKPLAAQGDAGAQAYLRFISEKVQEEPGREHNGDTLPEPDPEEPKPLPEDNFDDQKKAGVAAYHAGKYEEAYRLLKPLAAQGDADAQAYLRFISEKVQERKARGARLD